MAARRASFGLSDRPMVEPGDDVPTILAGGGHAGRPIPFVERDQRAGGIERDAGNRLLGHTGGGARRAHRGRDRRPDVVGALLGMVLPRPVERDRMLGPSKHAAVRD